MILIIVDGFSLVNIFKIIKEPNSENVISDLLANAGGEIIFGLLGIVMTVVAIIVELASNRYTARVSDLFVRDKVNMLYLILLSITSIDLIIILFFSRDYLIPHFLISLTTLFMVICVLTLVPYFVYVFKFLEPDSIISRIELDILNNIKKVRLIKKISKKNKLIITNNQIKVVQGIDQLADIVLNSIDKYDKVLATSCIKSMKTLINNYLDIKQEENFIDQWYHPSDIVRFNNADFVTLMDYSFDLIVKEKSWLEHKIFRQLNTIFQESLNKSRDICNFTAQCFQVIGLKAIENNNINIINLIIKFFNTMLRASINSNDIRTCFNLLNQYRLLGENLIKANKSELIIEIANYFKYYGMIAKELKGMNFILETTAHDLCYLNRQAYLNGLDENQEILNIILTIDQTLEGEKISSLRGIRKAQIMLFCFYMSLQDKKSKELAQRIFLDITDEIDLKGGFVRIFDIIKELKYIKAEFWEIIDRGVNIDYLSDEHKKFLIDFFNWLVNRQIIFYSYNFLNDNLDKNEEIINDFFICLQNLPKEIPSELIDFEDLFGRDKLDNRKNIFEHIIKLSEKLNDDEELKDKILLIKAINLNQINETFIKSIRKGFYKFRDNLIKKVKRLL
ncbi:MAG: DUF2254 domain-containing protein [Spirochaetes bacterium]|nr:DUF2254 domain-containing protein [Spirochaetota bacterium]